MERSAGAEAFAERMYERMRAGDGETLAGMIVAEGALFVGTDAEEWWDTSEAAKAAFREQMTASGGFDVRAGNVIAYAEGDVAWLADQPVMRIGDHDVTMRMTAVLRRSGDSWEIVQGHLSVAANVNDDLFG
jgi:ketosteroid isomerase-like protein